MPRICRSCVCPLLLLKLNHSWNPANFNHRFGIMSEAGTAVHTCHDITSQLFLTLCFWFLCTDDRDEAFLYHLSRLRKHLLLIHNWSYGWFPRKWRAYRAIVQLQTATPCTAVRYLYAHMRANENSFRGSQALTCKLVDGRTEGCDQAKTCFSAGFHCELTRM